jgi:FkbM family methyltransferase
MNLIKKTNIFSKAYKYFIYKRLSKYIFRKAVKANRKLFVFLFNLFSILRRSNNRIFIKENFYYNKELNWRFFNKRQGLYAYGNGFKKRKEELLSAYLIKNLYFNDKDNIIDIGANNGDFYLCFEKEIKYYGFEPSPIVFSNLKHNIKNQNLYNLGVSNLEDKNIEFFLDDEFGDSSILPIYNYTNKITIETTTLDKIIHKIQKKIKLIKVEAEGYEPEILWGLKKYINEVEYITIDCGFERGIERKSTIAECSNYLIQNNFKMIDFGSPRIVALYKNLNY